MCQKRTYSNTTNKNKENKWATYKASENSLDSSGYLMHVELGEGKAMNFKHEDIKKATDKYDNVEEAE